MRFYLLLLISIFLYSCITRPYLDSNGLVPCSKEERESYSEISYGIFEMIHNGDTTGINEVRYECANTAFIVSKTIYDHYGKWNRVVELDERQTLLVWDSLDSDELSHKSILRDSIINHVTLLIDEFYVKSVGDSFYKDYWMDVNPSHWNRIQAQKRRRGEIW